MGCFPGDCDYCFPLQPWKRAHDCCQACHVMVARVKDDLVHASVVTSGYNLMNFLKQIIFGQPCLNTACHMWPFSPPSLSPYGHPHALEGVYGERVDGIHSPETLITTFIILCVSQ